MAQIFDPKDIPTERPAVFDENGNRLFLYPAAVKGFFRTYRTWVYWFLIAIFMILPWTTWNGQQTILMDLPNRRFTFFGATFWAHDTPFLFFPLMIAVFAIALITAVFGRAWCGWACPQTVFIDAVFRKIESLVEGNHVKQRALAKKGWDIEKVWKRFAKWTLFTLASLHISHSFFAYFVGANELVWITMGNPLNNWTLFLLVQISALILLFDFGWFREQFCIIMCPYGRFQSVLMDKHSQAVMYDEKRGEPRGKTKKDSKEKFGDCINCNKCVAVCPTGVDIRNGLQLECIACTACIDACDEIMSKLGRQTGLIRYSTEAKMSGESAKNARPRVFAYAGLIVGLLLAFTYLVNTTDTLNLQVLRAIEAPYKIVNSANGKTVINHFRIHLNNHLKQDLSLKNINSTGQVEIVSPTLPHKVGTNKDAWIHFFVKSDVALVDLYSGSIPLDLILQNENGEEILRETQISLLGPTK